MADTQSPTDAAPKDKPSDAPTAAEDMIEVDSAADEPEAEFDEQLSRFTASLSSSVFDFPIEHGRRYHAYHAGAYMFPNDEEELKRLDMMHLLLTRAIGDKLYTAPLDEGKLKTVLDIGTGTGSWAIDMGNHVPTAQIIGNDLSPVQPNWAPPNVKFEVDDVESDWAYNSKFDFIFCRYMAASILDWPKLVGSIFENLHSGGWAEFQDMDFEYYSDDGTLTREHYSYKWLHAITDFLASIGRSCSPGPSLKKWVEEAGFTNVRQKVIKIPLGPWARDQRLKELGMINIAQLLDGLEGLSVKPLAACGYKEDEITTLNNQVRKELTSKAFHAYWTLYVVSAQKPE